MKFSAKSVNFLNFQEAFLDWERNEDPEEQEGKVLYIMISQNKTYVSFNVKP